MWNTQYMTQTFYIPHHFQYSNKLNQSNLSKMKTNIDQIVKLPKDVDLLTFKVLSENVVFPPGEKNIVPSAQVCETLTAVYVFFCKTCYFPIICYYVFRSFL